MVKGDPFVFIAHAHAPAQVEADDPSGRVNPNEVGDEDSEQEEFGGDYDGEVDDDGVHMTRQELEEAVDAADDEAERWGDGACGACGSCGSCSSDAPKFPPVRRRASRTIKIVSKASGQETRDGGEVRTVTQRHKQPGIFTASSYFWLYFAVYPAPGITIVPVGTVAKEGEAHAILDPCENYDADAVPDSSSTYDFAGIDPGQPGLLYGRTLPCVAACCRAVSSIRLGDIHRCGHWQTTGTHPPCPCPVCVLLPIALCCSPQVFGARARSTRS